MHFYIINIEPHYPREVVVNWSMDPGETLTPPLIYFVERSGSPEGPFNILEGPLPETITTYTDCFATGSKDKANLLSLDRSMYYRVRATDSLDNEAITQAVNLDNIVTPFVENPIPMIGYTVNSKFQPVIEPETFHTIMTGTGDFAEKRRILLRRKLLREHYIYFKLKGVKIYAIKRKHWGAPCDCKDPLTKGQTLYACTKCYGSGWQNGFYTPIESRAVFHEAATRTDTNHLGNTAQVSVTALMMASPQLHSKDILVEATTNRRWIVDQTLNPEIKRALVTQQLQVSELSRDSIEYEIPVS